MKNNAVNIIKISLLIILIIIVCGVVLLVSIRSIKQSKLRKKLEITTANGINSLEKINLGGIKQWILIRGKDKNKPVLVYLHGGPGAPLFRSVYKIGVQAGFEDNFVVVYWEQRGTGKSYSKNIDPASMTVDQIVSDTSELSQLMAQRFNKDKVYLLGHSWGTIVGMKAIAKNPEFFNAYIGMGQVVNIPENEKISYDYTLNEAKKAKNTKAIKELEAIGTPPYSYKETLIERNWLRSYGGTTYGYNKADGRISGGTAKEVLASPYYTFSDLFNMSRHATFSMQYLWPQIANLDFEKEIPKINVPLWFFVGMHDYTTSFELAIDYYNKLEDSKGKHLVKFEKSSHRPFSSDPEKTRKAIVQVLKETE